ncbi:hypothetical protein BH20ACT19_BH20ACT19_05240 [soil metagenome]
MAQGERRVRSGTGPERLPASRFDDLLEGGASRDAPDEALCATRDRGNEFSCRPLWWAEITLYTVLYMAATRTQIYLTADQRARLDAIRRREGKSLAQVVRDAVDAHVGRSSPSLAEVLEATAGTMPDLKVPSRDEWDRGYG